MARTEGDGTRDPGRPSSGPDHPIDVPPILAERHPDVPWRAFFRLYRDLPRAGPGTDACTRRALDLVGELGPGPSVYDLGCGPGRQTLVLARELGSKVVALDLVLHFLEELRAAAEAAGLGALVDPRLGDMAELGGEVEAHHAAVGRQAQAAGIEALWSCGTHARAASAAFGPNGRHYDSLAELNAALRAQAAGFGAILVKGSRSAGMDAAVAALQQDTPDA